MELYSDKIAHYHFYTFVAGIIILVAGILISGVVLIKIGAVLLVITAVLYNYNVFKIILHKEKQL